MKNKELRETLEAILKDSDELDAASVSLLQDASIHLALKKGLSLRAVSLVYVLSSSNHDALAQIFLLAGHSQLEPIDDDPDLARKVHEIMTEFSGVPEKKTKEEVPEHERKQINNLLNGLNLDL